MITREAFTKAIEQAVALRGEDHVYQSNEHGRCFYHDPHTGESGCIIGTALDIMGMPLDASAEGMGATAVLRPMTPDNHLIKAAQAAQLLQDVGTPWGEALHWYHMVLADENVYDHVRDLRQMKAWEKKSFEFETNFKNSDTVTFSWTDTYSTSWAPAPVYAASVHANCKSVLPEVKPAEKVLPITPDSYYIDPAYTPAWAKPISLADCLPMKTMPGLPPTIDWESIDTFLNEKELVLT